MNIHTLEGQIQECLEAWKVVGGEASAVKDGASLSLPLSAYTGIFENDFTGKTQVSLKDNKLRMQYGTAFEGEQSHWENDTLLANWEDPSHAPTDIHFHVTGSGQVDSLIVDNKGVFKHIA